MEFFINDLEISGDLILMTKEATFLFLAFDVSVSCGLGLKAN